MATFVISQRQILSDLKKFGIEVVEVDNKAYIPTL